MKKIVYDEGYRTYQVGDSDRVIKIRLDPEIFNRLNGAEVRINEIVERLKSVSVEELPEISTELKDIINEAFGTDVCTPAFDGANVFTLVSADKMLFQSFFEAFIPVLKEDIKSIRKNHSQPRPEVQKYLKPSAPAPDLSRFTPEKLALLEQLLS